MDLIKIQKMDDVLVVDSRLIAARLDIQHDTFMKTLKEYQPKIEQRFGVFRLEVGKPLKGSRGGRPEVYALLNEDQATVLMTFSRNSDAVIEAKLDLVEAFKKAKTLIKTKPLLPRWHRRLVDYHRGNVIQKGRFCVFFETSALVVTPLEAKGYQMPDRLMPDISVGIGFSNYLKSKKIDLKDPEVRTRYKLKIPKMDSDGYLYVEPWQYTNSLAGEFRDYVDSEWWDKQAFRYFKEKDGDAMQYVCQQLGLPYYAQLSLFGALAPVDFLED